MSFATRMNWLLFGGGDREWDKALSLVADRLETLKKLENKVQALEIKHEEIKGRTLGWQKGFGDEVRNQLQRMDERIAKLLESDDSADFEIRQWIEEMQALRKDVKALEKRVEAVENIKPILVPVRDVQSDRTPVIPFHVPPYQPIRTWPDSNPDPFKFTCQMKEEVSD